MKKTKKWLALLLAVILCVPVVQLPAMEAEAAVTNLALNKTVYCSSEEGASGTLGTTTTAEMAVDGKTNTCWTAATKDAANNWDAKYPEWLCVDLGKAYEIDRIEIQFESKGGARYYGYNVYTASDIAPTEGTSDVPAGYTKVADRENNTVTGVQDPVTGVGTARYVLIEVTYCNQYNTSQKWQAASIYELAVYGEDGVTVPDDEPLDIPIQTASGRDETYVQELDGAWQFGGRALSASAALSADYSTWRSVTIPHTWNNMDAEDGGGNYERTAYWYHKEFTVDAEMLDQRVYVEFLGSNVKTDVYVNGTKVGDTHKGGYTTFRYDITDYIRSGANVMDVRVDNTADQEVAPISGDFNMYGGIYRRVYLIAVDDVHVDLEQNGSSGLFLTTGNMRSKTAPADLGTFTLETVLVNDSSTAKTVQVVTTITGNNAPAPATETVTIPANGSLTYKKVCKVENPTLWEGIDYSRGADNSNVGYQYTVSLQIKDGNTVLDQVSDKLGFRYFWIDASADGDSGEGFYLNGEKYPLRGVNRHSYLAGVGSAMTEEQHLADMEMMLELGVNTIRLCHYPQTDYFYDLCDANGIIVWTEIPLVNMIGSASTFAEVTRQQLTELISQQYNRPSVCFWGLENEIGNGTSLTNATANAMVAKAKALLKELDELTHELDPTGRYTTQAVNRDYAMDQNDPDSVDANLTNNIGWKSDLMAWNIYPGWYPDANFYGTFEDVMVRKTALDSRPMGISEYGWGANVNQHEAYPELGKNNLTSGGTWHPEEYQNIMNEEALTYINTHDELWGTYYWVMFDFAVDARNEGSQAALNDKGLVTADRSVKKDSFYLYKANWNQNDPFTYITSRRWTNRETSDTYVKVYSNCDNVELFLNGKSLGMMESKGNGVFLMEDVSLAIGENKVETVGTYTGETQTYTDTCIWSRQISNKADLESEVYAVDTTQKTIMVDGDVTLEAFQAAVKGVNNAVYQIYSGETAVTDGAAKVVPGMTILVTAEDGETTAVYSVISSNLCVGKDTTVSSTETGNEKEHAVDGDSSTRWVASDGTYPQWIVVDLAQDYYLGDLTLDWETKGGGRYYRYYVEVSQDGVNYTEVIDRRSNTDIGVITDDLGHVRARYIRITATGCNQAGWMTLFEIKADGYMITSDTYTIDEKNQLIILDELPEAGLAEGIFAGNIQVSGNYTYRINLSSGWIHDGNTVEFFDRDQNLAATYTICTEETKEQYYKPDVDDGTADEPGTDPDGDGSTPGGTTDETPGDGGNGSADGSTDGNTDGSADGSTGGSTSPQTGDSSRLLLFVLLIMASGSCLIWTRKKRALNEKY